MSNGGRSRRSRPRVKHPVLAAVVVGVMTVVAIVLLRDEPDGAESPTALATTLVSGLDRGDADAILEIALPSRVNRRGAVKDLIDACRAVDFAKVRTSITPSVITPKLATLTVQNPGTEGDCTKVTVQLSQEQGRWYAWLGEAPPLDESPAGTEGP